MFAMPFRATIDQGASHVSEWPLSSEHSLLVTLQRGDTLRCVQGTVWCAAEDGSTTRTLCTGDVHTVARNGVWRLIGADRPRVAVGSHSPVIARTQADYGCWRLSPALPTAH